MPITQQAMDLIASLPKQGDYVFSANGTSHDIRKLARDSWQDKKSRDRLGFLVMERGEMLLNHERDGLDKRYMHTHSREQMRKALGIWKNRIDR
ncbi:hypothetical protein [Marinomonas aquiplantarum]|uniref:hypothetical protein n=1 Tax=Marinomonas aquiplantarum TaxID=491951 RepID=UPI0011BF220E|nr:hypothetical protein [Marinomonas aquiplantarum]